ncbi:MAG TPA: Gfo/Idh/MocA family oxidoreductase [Bacteroidota bacterium]|nr:Gfo/Idh/MocA family oxidoreductase [Bacteroidota bacterium]
MNTPLGVGVIGVGILGSRHARVYKEQESTTLVGLADSSLAKAGEIAGKFGGQAFDDYRTMIQTLGPSGNGSLQAVSVSTPDFAHFEIVRTCLNSGLDVFVEKPLTMDPDEAQQLINLAAEKKRVLMVNYSQRWLPEHRRIETLIHSSELGTISFIESHRWDAAWVPQRMINWGPKTTPIHFMSSHDIDLICYWLDDRVAAVQAMANSGILSKSLGDPAIVDGIVAHLRFAKGAVVSLHSSWILPAGFPLAADTYLEVLGESGSVFLSGSSREFRLYKPDSSEKLTYGGPATANEVQGRLEGAFVKSLLSFVDAVRCREMDTPTSAARTLHVVEVQDAIMRAATSGCTIELKG